MKIGKKMITGSGLLMMIGVIFATTILVSAAVVVLSATKTNGLQPVGDFPVRLTMTTGQDYQNLYAPNTNLDAWTAASVTAGNSYGERFAAQYNGQSTPAYMIMVTVYKLGSQNQEIQDNDIAVGYHDVIANQEEFIPTWNTQYSPIQFQPSGSNTMVGIIPLDTEALKETIVWMNIVPQVGGEDVYFVLEYKAVPAYL
jgi:hypothetical protein